MLYWLLLLVCAYASTSSAQAAFAVGQKWQIILSEPPIVTNTSKVVPLDALVWDIDTVDTDAGVIGALHAQGKIVICYFSAGTYESWRPDANQFTAADKGASLAPQWPDENWLNTKSANVRRIMSARIELAASKGCDAVDPDNVGMRLIRSNNPPFPEEMRDGPHEFGMIEVANRLNRRLCMETLSLFRQYARVSGEIRSLQDNKSNYWQMEELLSLQGNRVC
jgi:hypothetical protein